MVAGSSPKSLVFDWNLRNCFVLDKKNRLKISGQLFEVMVHDLIIFCNNNIIIWNSNIIIQYRRYSILLDYLMILIWSWSNHLRLPLNVIDHLVIGPIKPNWNHTTFFWFSIIIMTSFFCHFSVIFNFKKINWPEPRKIPIARIEPRRK